MAGDVHRLNDIEVEEVSLVDRAANKRKFLLVKREGEGSMDTLVADGRGGFKRVAKADKGEDDKDDEDEKKKAAAETEKAKGPPTPPTPPTPPGAKKPGDKDEEDDDKKKKPFGGAKAPPFGKKPAEKADAEGTALADDLADLCEEMMDVIETMQGAEEAEPAEMSAKDKAKKVLEKARAAFAARKAAREEAAKADVAKAGRKISQSRLDKLKGALAALDGVIKEVDGDLAGDDAKEKTAKAATEVTVDEELKKSVLTLCDRTAKVIEENAALAKRADEQATEIAQLKKGVPVSNSQNPERAPAKKSADEKPWPMNMNPKRASRLAKGGKSADADDSFLDD